MASLSLSIADRPPEDPAKSTDFHMGLIEILNSEARERHGWAGSEIKDYGKLGGIAFLQLVPAEKNFATIDDLRAFREMQRADRERDQQQPEQGVLC